MDLIDGTESLFGSPVRKDESREFKPVLRDLNLPVVMFVSHVDLRSEETTRLARESLKHLIDQAVFFGASYFRVITGVRSPGGLFEPGVMENVLEGLRWCLSATAEAGLPLLLENHHETTDELMTLCRMLGGEGLRLNCEIKPPFRYNMDPQAFVERLIPFAETYHIDNFSYADGPDLADGDRAGRSLDRAVPVQEGEIDVRSILSAIKTSGFDGWLSIEYGGPVDHFDHVAESAAWIRSTWDSL